MKFVLFRHAHKGIQPFDDPELSIPGFEQAAQLVEMVNKHQLPTPTRLLVSPRRRASQTLYPLSRGFAVPLEIKNDLDQAASQENGTAFRKRIENFLNEITALAEKPEAIFACTHYDWIETAMPLINSDKDLTTFEFSHWSPTQHIEFEITSGVWTYIKKGAAK